MNKTLTTAVATLAAAALIFGGAASANASDKGSIAKADRAAISVYDKAHAHDNALEAKAKKEAKSNYGQAIKTYEQAVKAWRDTIKKYDAAVKQINKTYAAALAVPMKDLNTQKATIAVSYEKAIMDADAAFASSTEEAGAALATREAAYAAAETAKANALALAESTFNGATAEIIFAAQTAKDAALADLGKKPAAPIKPTKPGKGGKK